jgi:hypothetical protein
VEVGVKESEEVWDDPSVALTVVVVVVVVLVETVHSKCALEHATSIAPAEASLQEEVH